jgi:bacteriocin biosynthesis cyclodehydratase domain-containing protein
MTDTTSQSHSFLHKPKRLRFRSEFHVEVVYPECVYFLSERQEIAISGCIYCNLAELIVQGKSYDEILKSLRSEAITEFAIMYAVTKLFEKGLIEEECERLSYNSQAVFWDFLQQSSSNERNEQSQHLSLTVINFSRYVTRENCKAIQNLVIEKTNFSNLSVIFVDDYLDERLYCLNKKYLDSGEPWILAKIAGSIIWIGPLFIPHISACWLCLAQRLRDNREIHNAISYQKPEAQISSLPLISSEYSLKLGLDFFSVEISKVIHSHYRKDNDKELVFSLKTLDIKDWTLKHHAITRMPQCSQCGDPHIISSQALLPIDLVSNNKVDKMDAEQSVKKLLSKYEHLISPLSGIVRSLTPVHQEDDYIYIYRADHKMFEQPKDIYSLRKFVRQKSTGKGQTDEQARMSAIGEALERYSGIYQGNEYKIQSSWENAEFSKIHPNQLLNFSENQYENRSLWNKEHSTFNWIPQRFNERKIIDWTPVWCLTKEKFFYIPTAYCYYNYPMEQNHLFCNADSNGNAAGGNLAQAFLNGFYELVERDGVAIWWYNRVSRPGISLESLGDPYFEKIKQKYNDHGREIWILDITSDLGIPIFAAVSSRNGKEIILGFGCNINPKIALIRAVTELNQSFFISTTDNLNKDWQIWFKKANLDEHSYLIPEYTHSLVKENENKDQGGEVLWCLDIMKNNNMDILLLNQTRPDVTLNVVKVIIPGLRHFWARFAPGRLYDVPVNLKWLNSATPESDLNPLPIFI